MLGGGFAASTPGRLEKLLAGRNDIEIIVNAKCPTCLAVVVGNASISLILETRLLEPLYNPFGPRLSPRPHLLAELHYRDVEVLYPERGRPSAIRNFPLGASISCQLAGVVFGYAAQLRSPETILALLFRDQKD